MLAVALILSIILALESVYRFKKLLNPFTFEAYFTILFLIIPQLILIQTEASAKSFFYSDLVIITYIVSIYIGTFININLPPIRGIQNVNIVNTLNLLLYALLILPIIPILLQAGLTPNGIREFYETVVFSKYASFYELSKLMLYFVIFYKLIRHERFTLGFFALCPLVMFYGSRFVILDFILYLCIYLEQYKNVRLKTVIMICMTGATVIAVYTYLQFSLDNFYYLFTAYFDIYKNQSFIVEKLLSGEVDYYYGEIYTSSYLKYIPRIFWEDKPKAFGFAILNYDFMPQNAKAGYMPSFGLGSTFADFGFLSIAVTGLLAGILKNNMYRLFLKSKNNATFFLYILPLSFVTTLFLFSHYFLDFITRKSWRKVDTHE